MQTNGLLYFLLIPTTPTNPYHTCIVQHTMTAYEYVNRLGCRQPWSVVMMVWCAVWRRAEPQ